MSKLVGAAAFLVIVLSLTVAILAAAVTGGLAGSSPSAAPDPSATTTSGAIGQVADLPPGWQAMEVAAAATCPGLPWSVLAAIGALESDSGRSTSPGVSSGANAAGAQGPMQFEPATFAAYATVGPGGASPANPYDPIDAVYSAATMLCADGAGTASGLRNAIFAYNHDRSYVDRVLTLSLVFADDPSVDRAVVAAIGFAAGQLGKPYRWGGNGPDGFDCSGLTLAAFRAAGTALPRVAQDQFTRGPAVVGGDAVRPGDLLFFGTGPAGVDHVGIYVGSGLMLDAPHTGAVVRVEPAGWEGFVGATRPG